MKKNLLIALIFSLPVCLYAQVENKKDHSQGKIIYAETNKIEIKVEGNEQLPEGLPDSQTSYKELIFNHDASIYRNSADQKEEDEIDNQAGVVRFKIITGGANDVTYTDFKSQQRTEQKEFMTRNFLIDSKFRPDEWKLTSEFSEILGFNCQAAVSSDTASKVKVWFTPSIPVSGGPAGYTGLPGMVMKVEAGNGKKTITASKIDFSEIESSILKKPSSGKKVTSEEFKKIVDDKMKEMGQENGKEGAHVVIKYRR